VSARGWGLFAAVSVVWGIPYFFINVAVDADIPPAFVAWSRVTLGALILLPLAAHRGALDGLGAHWRPIVLYAATEIAVPFTLIAIGEQHVSSSLTAILISSMPLAIAVMSIPLSLDDRPTGLRLVGLLMGLGGVVALVGIDVAGKADELLGAVLILIAMLGYATAPIVVRLRLSDLDPLGPIAVSLAGASLVLLPAAIIAPPPGSPGLDAIGSIVMLGFVCTALGLVLFFALITEAGPNRASLITYFNPLVAVTLGVIVLDEHVGAASVVGLALILSGSWLATGGRIRMRRRAAAA
jgi:drug/metabolite transporter (DMT)-like permease